MSRRQISPLLEPIVARDATPSATADDASDLQSQRLIGGLIVADESGTLTDWSPTALRLHGFASLEEVRRHVHEFTQLFELYDLSGRRLNFDEWPLPRLMRGELVDNLEMRLRRLDTNQEWFINYSGAVMAGPGDSTHKVFVLLLQDVTEWRRAIDALRRSARSLRDNQMLLQTLLDGISDPVYVKTSDGHFRYVNDAVARLADRDQADCIDATDIDLFGPKLGKAIRMVDQHVIALQKPRTYEETVHLGDETRHYLTTKVPYRDAEGMVAGLLGLSRDVTSLKHAEAALRHSAEHLRDVLDSLLVSVTVLTLDGLVLEMNATARSTCATLGTPFEQLKDRPLVNASFLTQSPATREALGSAILTASRGSSVRLANLDVQPIGGGKPAAFDVAVAPMEDADGLVRHLILSAIDVTERRIAETLAREQQAELAHLERVQTMGHMAAGLAHELNQPLGAIGNYVAAGRQMLSSSPKIDPGQVDRILSDIGSESTRAGEIIRRMRGFVRKQRPQPQAIDIGALINESLRILNFELRHADVKPDVSLAPDLPRVRADSVQITQVFVNLVRNALDAMDQMPPRERRLAISTSLDPGGGTVRVSVADAGEGIDPKNLGRIFDAFFTTKSHGMGMGLALCRIIIEEHGGRISATPNPKRGMTFSFTLRPATGDDADRPT